MMNSKKKTVQGKQGGRALKIFPHIKFWKALGSFSVLPAE